MKVAVKRRKNERKYINKKTLCRLGLFYHYGFFQDEKQINDILHKLFEAFKVKSDFSLDFQNESPNAKFKEVKLYFEPHFATFYDYLEFEKYLYESEKGE